MPKYKYEPTPCVYTPQNKDKDCKESTLDNENTFSEKVTRPTGLLSSHWTLVNPTSEPNQSKIQCRFQQFQYELWELRHYL